ncbi:MAG: hypothetical protein P8J26_03585, partial [Pseudomonadales bacterium]|nr:hypothetical protein [Pseudomonadales bacterium]
EWVLLGRQIATFSSDAPDRYHCVWAAQICGKSRLQLRWNKRLRSSALQNKRIGFLTMPQQLAVWSCDGF